MTAATAFGDKATREELRMTVRHGQVRARPAEKHVLGRLAPGMAADITIFDFDTIGSPERPEVRNDLPGGARRLVTTAEGIKYTIVNGQVIFEGIRHTGALPGRVLRSGQPTA